MQVVDVDNVRQKVTVKLIPRIDLQMIANKLVRILWILDLFLSFVIDELPLSLFTFESMVKDCNILYNVHLAVMIVQKVFI